MQISQSLVLVQIDYHSGTLCAMSESPRIYSSAKTESVPASASAKADVGESAKAVVSGESAEELGGPEGLEPTRYGDWERKGRCIDF
jgi:hypothetical protein